jgi:hypothetical protein
MARVHRMLYTVGNKYTFRIYSTYCFFTATMVARRLLIVTLYVLCLVCSLFRNVQSAFGANPTYLFCRPLLKINFQPLILTQLSRSVVTLFLIQIQLRAFLLLGFHTPGHPTCLFHEIWKLKCCVYSIIIPSNYTCLDHIIHVHLIVLIMLYESYSHKS